MKVFNRWGQLVFETTNPTDFWLGEADGQAAPADVYIYQMQYQFEEGDVQNLSGQLTLAR